MLILQKKTDLVKALGVTSELCYPSSRLCRKDKEIEEASLDGKGIFRTDRRAAARVSDGQVCQAGERLTRSEERRVGKECRSRWSPYH